MRTYDVVAFQIPDYVWQQAPQELWALDGQGRAATGIIKLAQHVLLELLTVKGSRPFDSKSGTSLLVFARQGRIRSEIDAYAYFQYAVGEMRQTLYSRERATDPDDERFDSLTITSLTFTPQHLVYNLNLSSLAGTTRTVVLPVAISPGTET